MTLTLQEKQLVNDIINVTELYNNMSHENQINKLRDITDNDKFPIQKIQDILNIKYNTAQAYFKKAKQSKAGNWMGNKIPLEYVCKLCLYYNRSLKWFLENN